MRTLGVVESMKDFYWDIRPKPEFGTIEIRVCDTPLTVEMAAGLTVYAQCIAAMLLDEVPHRLSEDIYLPYTYNRFSACRFGLEGEIIEAHTGEKTTIARDIQATLERIAPHSRSLDAMEGLREIAATVGKGNDARRMREAYGRSDSLSDLVHRQSLLWRGEASA